MKQQGRQVNITEADLRTIVTDPEGGETLVRVADALGEELKEHRLTTSQIRALFGEVRQIQAQWGMGGDQNQAARRRLILLKPKMAYRARKTRNVEGLVNVLDPAVDLVISERDLELQDANFRRFVEFFEAILAYHKSYGGN